jgi:hypothetical protein
MTFDKNWRGIMKVLEIKHWRNGKVIWEQNQILNLLHNDGEEYVLRAAFNGGRISNVIPENFYMGLDNRQFPAAGDTMDSLISEPSSNGYTRQPISSAGDFTVVEDSSHFRAVSPIMAFQAAGGNWGPVQNLFLTDRTDNTGYLISTATLQTPITVNDGETVTLRLAMQLRDCPIE